MNRSGNGNGQFSLFSGSSILDRARDLFAELHHQPEDSRIDAINELRRMLHEISPFRNEPVDLVLWVKSEGVVANDYNPNSVAPPEMKLLEHSITEDGYTQPIVAWKRDDQLEVVDGFHRNRVGRESPRMRRRLSGYLPVTIINSDREDRSDRIAATIRHNRARGKHQVQAMSDIVIELKRRNWANERISRELGMDEDEILRLCQITGLAELFSDQEFSRSWDVEGQVSEEDFKELTDDISTYGAETEDFRTVNTADDTRIFHTHDKWECYKAGFYATTRIQPSAIVRSKAKCWAPSWRRMCKVLLRNDYWCKGLGQTQPKSEAYIKFKEMKKEGSSRNEPEIVGILD